MWLVAHTAVVLPLDHWICKVMPMQSTSNERFSQKLTEVDKVKSALKSMMVCSHTSSSLFETLVPTNILRPRMIMYLLGFEV